MVEKETPGNHPPALAIVIPLGAIWRQRRLLVQNCSPGDTFLGFAWLLTTYEPFGNPSWSHHDRWKIHDINSAFIVMTSWIVKFSIMMILNCSFLVDNRCCASRFSKPAALSNVSAAPFETFFPLLHYVKVKNFRFDEENPKAAFSIIRKDTFIVDSYNHATHTFF